MVRVFECLSGLVPGMKPWIGGVSAGFDPIPELQVWSLERDDTVFGIRVCFMSVDGEFERIICELDREWVWCCIGVQMIGEVDLIAAAPVVGYRDSGGDTLTASVFSGSG